MSFALNGKEWPVEGGWWRVEDGGRGEKLLSTPKGLSGSSKSQGLLGLHAPSWLFSVTEDVRPGGLRSEPSRERSDSAVLPAGRR